MNASTANETGGGSGACPRDIRSTFDTSSFSEFAVGTDCPDTAVGANLLQLTKLSSPAGNVALLLKGQFTMSASTDLNLIAYGSEGLLLDDSVTVLAP